MPGPALTLKNVTKTYGSSRGIKNISLDVEAGEIFGFLGPNGSGKTTTIRMLCGLLIPDSGTGTCQNYDSNTVYCKHFYEHYDLFK